MYIYKLTAGKKNIERQSQFTPHQTPYMVMYVFSKHLLQCLSRRPKSEILKPKIPTRIFWKINQEELSLMYITKIYK